LLETLRYNLERAGFSVDTAADGLAGLERVRAARPDLVVLDLMLPGLDGFSVCRAIAREGLIPVVILTALCDEAHRIAGLELGAIDYIVKPFSMAELLARLRAILRWSERQRQLPARELIEAGPIRLDRSSRRAWRSQREVVLSHKEFDLLACLIHSAGVALSRDLLLERVWGSDFLGSNRTIDVHVRWLREKLEDDPSRPALIRTVRGIGYCFQDPAAEPAALVASAWAESGE
jgi:DNA-binding response OmpR family regulator